MFSLFNFLSIFPGGGGQLTPFAPVCGRPWTGVCVGGDGAGVASSRGTTRRAAGAQRGDADEGEDQTAGGEGAHVGDRGQEEPRRL